MTIVALIIAVGSLAPALQPPPAPPPPLMQEPQTLLLWPNGAPGAQGSDDRDKPAITVYMPPNTAGPLTAVIIAPGGSYQRLSMNLEGREPANYFNAMGIAAFVLRYRLGPQYHHPIELGDAQRAIRTVRARAAEWHIAPDRIGFMGFSAGGHLASSAATQFDGGNPNAPDPIDRVFITSVSAEMASSNRGDYCISKAGLAMAARLFAARLAEHGVPVYEVRPGIIATDMTAAVRQTYDRRIADGLVPERRWGQPDDVGRVVAALLRGDLPYATGSIINVDGGISIPRL